AAFTLPGEAAKRARADHSTARKTGMNDTLGVPAPVLRAVPRDQVRRFAEPRRRIVVVLGPPNSGTSLCSYALSLLGVDMTEPGAGQPFPAAWQEADWERQPVKQFHDRLLRLFNRGGADGSCIDFAMPVAWWADPRAVAIRHEIAEFVADRL